MAGNQALLAKPCKRQMRLQAAAVIDRWTI
jgi:hypothetical protein